MGYRWEDQRPPPMRTCRDESTGLEIRHWSDLTCPICDPDGHRFSNENPLDRTYWPDIIVGALALVVLAMIVLLAVG